MVFAVISYNGKQHCCSLFWVKSVVIWLLMTDMGWVCRDSIWLHSWCRNTLNRQDFIECYSLQYVFLCLDTDSHIFYPKPQRPWWLLEQHFFIKIYESERDVKDRIFFSSGVYRSFGLTIILWRLHSVTTVLSLAHQSINSQRADIMSYSSSCP